MENKRAIFWSLLAALVALTMFWLYVNKAVDREIGDLKKKERVLKARVDIPAGMRIDESMFVEAYRPSVFIPKKAARFAQQIVGQVALATISEGELILTNKLIPFDESSLDRRIPEGYRAITLGIRDDQDVVGVGGMLRPGHFVDILITLFIFTKEFEKGKSMIKPRDPNLRGIAEPLKAETRTLFQNIKIIAVGMDFRLDAANVSRTGGGIRQRSLTNKNITVIMPPDKVQELVLAQQVGRVTLSLRRFNDSEVIRLGYTDPFKAFGIKLPVTSGPPPAYREIRGGQVFATPF